MEIKKAEPFTINPEVDSHFVKGYSHKICEDYAMVKNNAIVISDGCSSADYSDIGARLLSLAVMSAIDKSHKLYSTVNPKLIRYELGLNVKNYIEEYPTIADATYILACIDNTSLLMLAHGDGAIYIEYHNGDSMLIELQYPSGYPNYLSYGLDPIRQFKYLELDSAITCLHVTSTIMKGGVLSQEDWHIASGHFNFALSLMSNIKFVALMSDGIYSFSNAQGAIPSKDVTAQLTGFKSFKGDFVQRRFQGFERFCKENVWSHYDDVSMAAMYIPEIK